MHDDRALTQKGARFMSDDLVNVLVPRKHLSRVYGLIAELDGGTVTPAIPSTPGLAPADRQLDEWTPSRIRKMVDQSDTAMRAILKELATHAGEWRSTADLAAAIGSKANGSKADWNTVAGTMGAFGRRLKNRYALDTKPYERRREAGTGKVFRMSKEIAQQVLQAMKNGNARD